MPDQQPNYVSYLLRLWKSDEDGRPVWRASLESPTDRHQMNFASLETLLAFLAAQFGEGEEEEKLRTLDRKPSKRQGQ